MFYELVGKVSSAKSKILLHILITREGPYNVQDFFPF